MAALTEQQQRQLDRSIVEWRGRPTPIRGYPKPRARIGGTAVARPPVIAPPLVPAAAPPPPRTLSVGMTAGTGAGAVAVYASPRLSDPYIIRHVSFFSSATIANSCNWSLLFSPSDNVTIPNPGVTTPQSLYGQSIAQGIRNVGGGLYLGDYNVTSVPMDLWPNFAVAAAPTYLKIWFVNGSAATQQWSVIIDLEFLS